MSGSGEHRMDDGSKSGHERVSWSLSHILSHSLTCTISLTHTHTHTHDISQHAYTLFLASLNGFFFCSLHMFMCYFDTNGRRELIMNCSGNAAWWGHSLWQTTSPYGQLNPSYNFVGDIKSKAWTALGAQTHVMLIVHTAVCTLCAVQRGCV